jgi:uncharacterized ParB-like nuclease family protein
VELVEHLVHLEESPIQLREFAAIRHVTHVMDY